MTSPADRMSPETDGGKMNGLEQVHENAIKVESETEPTLGMDEQSTLDFIATAKDQDELERDIGRQADQLLTEQADERDNKRLEKTEAQRQRLKAQLRKIEQRLAAPGGSRTTTLLLNEKQKLETDIRTVELDLKQITARIAERHHDVQQAENERREGNEGQRPGESRREFLIRTGKITPFSKMPQMKRLTSNLAESMLEAEGQDDSEQMEEAEVEPASALEGTTGPRSHQILRRPGFAEDEGSGGTSADEPTPGRATKRLRRNSSHELREEQDPEDDFNPDREVHSVTESDSDAEAALALASEPMRKRKRGARAQRSRRTQDADDDTEGDWAGLDDGNETAYQSRVESWSRRRAAARRRAVADGVKEENQATDEEDVEEWQMPHPSRPDTHLDGGFKIPGDIYPSLYDYQKTGVRWLWELYSQQVGGIVGDEMGLGKTIQIISFIAGLHYSKMLSKPVIIVCPATVMKQWSNEFHTWWPALRVSILHSSGSGMLDMQREEEMEDRLDVDVWDDGPRRSKNYGAAKKIVDRVLKHGHVLVTTYSGLQTYADLLIDVEWGYAVLDEGHKIRNPNTAITIHCKELRTANRIILSGTPIQNNLTELWSLFDFVFPMRLGTLVSFRTQFETPIRIGGYANASNLQVETAIRCAEALKDTISPYLLQRWKVDVAADLPKKTERVLFCELTALQRQQYQIFLDSDDMKSILSGKRQSLFGIDILRKICNHPDLVDHKRLPYKAGYNYGEPSKSGKMGVVKGLLDLWKKAGHKTLLFAQHRIMLDILEKFVGKMDGIKYRRMDGNTSIKERQDLVDEFNKDPTLDVFLLTTKVGGLGVNLTGANRVIIYDPDWNPSTDVQARERAWRLGQKREVEIYRLMTAGTIEEKIYHRQVFKQILTNKVLKDPKQRQTFHLRELHDLFTLADPNDRTETGSLFKGTELQLSRNSSLPTPPGDGEEQIRTIRGVAAQEEFQGGNEEREKVGEGDERILSALFSRSGVHSAHEHDAIIAGSATKRKVQADPEMVAREARRVAAIAAAELQRAGDMARDVPIGVPTWTGQVGISGRPEPRGLPMGRGGAAGRGRGRGRGGPSSASILAGLAARQSHLAGGASSTSPAPAANQPRGKDFMALIRDYIRAHGGSVYTQMLIDHFNRYCGTEQRVAEFQEMLKRIATLEKGRNGRGKWSLKDGFK